MSHRKTSLLGGGLFVFAVACSLPIALSVRDKPFEASTWKTTGLYFKRNWPLPTSGGNFERAQMVEDLRTRHIRLGMSRKRIKSLLGPADVIDGTGNHGPIDIYILVEKPTRFQWWQAHLWKRYRTTEPSFALEYGGLDSHLIGISVG